MSNIRALSTAELAYEHAAWQAFIDVLEREEAALIAGDTDTLAALSGSKLAQVQSLSRHGRARNDYVASQGFEPAPAGIRRWLEQQHDPALAAQWTALEDCERRAHALNERIGKLVEMRLAATRQALNVLLACAHGQAGLYDPAGKPHGLAGGRPISTV